VLGPYSTFAAAGFIDPWIYTGYFTHFDYLINHFGITYYGSRLPWIIPGLAVFRLANPAVAEVLLHALILSCCSTSVFWIVYWHYGRLPALLACVALITNPYLISAVSWDYPNGASIAYGFVAMAFFLRPASKRLWPSLCAGAALALSAFSNLAAIPMVAGILTIPLWRYRRDLKGLLRQGLAALGGAMAVSVVLIAAYKWCFNAYAFFLPQIRMIQYVRAHPEYLATMWGTGYAWIPFAYRLSPALFTLFLGLVLLLRRRKWEGAYMAGYLCLAVTFGLLCLFEFQFHSTSLRVHYVGAFMMCPLLAFAGLLVGECCLDVFPVSHDSGPGQGAMRVATDYGAVPISSIELARLGQRIIWVAVAAVGLSLPFLYSMGLIRPFSGKAFWTATFGSALLVGAVIVARKSLPPLLAAVTICVLFTGLFLGPALDAGLGYVWSKENAGVFDALIKIEAAIDSQTPVDRKIWLWYDSRGRRSWLFTSASAIYLQGDIDFAQLLHSAPAAEIKTIVNSKTTFVHLTLDQDETPEHTRLLSDRGFVVGNERSSVILSPAGKMRVVLQDVLDDSAVH
jgi:hypothetical protein